MRIEHAGVVTLLSAGKPVIAEQEAPGCEADKAIDGRHDTCWAASPYYKWWQVDLQQPSKLSQIVIQAGSGREGSYTHYYIEHSLDLLNWDIVAEKISDTPSGKEGELYDVSVATRYIRVTVTYNSEGEIARLREVHIYGQSLTEEEGRAVKAELVDRSSPRKFPAVACDESVGFLATEVEDIELGRRDQVLVSEGVNSYLVFREVNFTATGVNQLRGQFGFPEPDKGKRITVEVRVDGLHGETIGQMVLFRQWKTWSVLGGQLVHTDPSLLTGVHDVYLVITDVEPPQGLMIHWLSFVRTQPLPAPRPRPQALPKPASGEFQIYFGNLHSHTGFSDGISVPEYAYDYARYTAGLDFLAITEHSNLWDHNLDWNRSRKWIDIQRMADRKTEEGAFLALIGSETTWYNQFGHMNTYNMDFFLNTYETRFNEISEYYNSLKLYPDSIQQWNHPWSCGNRHLDGFEPYDAKLDEVMHMIEINPIESKELGGLYYYVKALDKGWHVAPVGSQDNHHGQWGTQNTLRTGLLVERLTREHFYDAVRHQRVYFTSALHLKVCFKVNGAIMGSRIEPSDTLTIEVRALYGADTMRRIVKTEIIGEQGHVLHVVELDGRQLDLQVKLAVKDRYCFAKIYQDDGEFAATAPVWMEVRKD